MDRALTQLSLLADRLRRKLCPGLCSDAPFPIGLLACGLRQIDLEDRSVRVACYCASGLPSSVWAVTFYDMSSDTFCVSVCAWAWTELVEHRGVPGARYAPGTDWRRSRHTVAHELAHVILHPDEIIRAGPMGLAVVAGRCQAPAKLEAEASAFAGALLVPDAGLEEMARCLGDLTGEEVASQFRVTPRAACRRLREWATPARLWAA